MVKGRNRYWELRHRRERQRKSIKNKKIKKGEERERRRNIVKMNIVHLQSPLIPKEQPQGRISHWFDLKEEEKNGNSKKKKRDTRRVRLSILIRREEGSPACRNGDAPPKGSLLNTGSGDKVGMGLKDCSGWGSREIGG